MGLLTMQRQALALISTIDQPFASLSKGSGSRQIDPCDRSRTKLLTIPLNVPWKILIFSMAQYF